MNKKIRRLLCLAAVCLVGAPLSALAETPADPQILSAKLQFGSENYINTVDTRSVDILGNRMVVCDYGQEKTGGTVNGYLCFYADGVLTERYQSDEEYFNPQKAAFASGDKLYVLNRWLLEEIDFSAEPAQVTVIDTGVKDFRYAGGTLYTLTFDSGSKAHRINRYENGVKSKLYEMTTPVESFATDGTDFYYYETSTVNAPGLYKNGVLIDKDSPEPTELNLLNGTLLSLSGKKLLGVPASGFDVCGSDVWIVNQDKLDKYTLSSDGKLVSAHTGFSKTGELERPVSMAGGESGDCVLDAGQNTILLRSGTETSALKLSEIDPTFTEAKHLAVSGASVFAANGSVLLELDRTGGIVGRFTEYIPSGAAEPAEFSEIRAICVSVSGQIYVADQNGIYTKKKDSDSFRLLRNVRADALAVGSRNNKLYALSNEIVTILGSEPGSDVTVPAPKAAAFSVDFKNQIFALTSEGNLLRISERRNLEQNASPAFETKIFGLSREGILDGYGTKFDALCLNDYTGTISLVDSSLSLIFSVSKEDSGVALFSEVPVLDVPADPLDRAPNAEVSLAKIGGYPSTLLYPGADGVSAPEGTVEELVSLPTDTELWVLGWTADGDGRYAFVCVRESSDFDSPRFGFVLDTNLTLLEPEDKPFEEGYTGFETSFYKYPCQNTAFLSETLKKDVLLTLKDSPSEGWLAVSYEEGGETLSGFVRRSAVVKRIETTLDERKNAVTVGVNNETPLYEKPSISSKIIKTLPDKCKLKIIARTGAYCKVETEDGAVGYVETRFLVEEGFSNAQRLGLILFGSVAVVGLLAFLIRKKIIH